MNNEEKILAILGQMQGQMEKMDSRLDKLEQGQVRLEQGQKQIKEDIADVKLDVKMLWDETSIVEKHIVQHEREFHAV